MKRELLWEHVNSPEPLKLRIMHINGILIIANAFTGNLNSLRLLLLYWCMQTILKIYTETFVNRCSFCILKNIICFIIFNEEPIFPISLINIVYSFIYIQTFTQEHYMVLNSWKTRDVVEQFCKKSVQDREAINGKRHSYDYGSNHDFLKHSATVFILHNVYILCRGAKS